MVNLAPPCNTWYSISVPMIVGVEEGAVFMEYGRLHIVDVRGAARTRQLADAVIEQLGTLPHPRSEAFRRRLAITDAKDPEYLRSEVVVMTYRYLSIRSRPEEVDLLQLVWEQLFQRVLAIARGLFRARLDDRRDFVQDCERAVFEALRDPMRQQVDFWEANFYTACRRRCLDVLRQSHGKSPAAVTDLSAGQHQSGDPTDPPDPCVDVEDEALRNLDEASLVECIEQLPVQERDFCTQWIFREAPPRVLAQTFGVSERTIRNWKGSIRQKLRDRLNNSGVNV
jgi:RNA polymerase sigma factor (sigma-70 family)